MSARTGSWSGQPREFPAPYSINLHDARPPKSDEERIVDALTRTAQRSGFATTTDKR